MSGETESRCGSRRRGGQPGRKLRHQRRQAAYAPRGGQVGRHDAGRSHSAAVRRRGGQERIVAPDGSVIEPSPKRQRHETLVKALARAHDRKLLDRDAHVLVRKLTEAGEQEQVSGSLRLVLLAPEIVEGIPERRADRAVTLGWSQDPRPCVRRAAADGHQSAGRLFLDTDRTPIAVPRSAALVRSSVEVADLRAHLQVIQPVARLQKSKLIASQHGARELLLPISDRRSGECRLRSACPRLRHRYTVGWRSG
jgi:hypothetical protein